MLTITSDAHGIINEQMVTTWISEFTDSVFMNLGMHDHVVTPGLHLKGGYSMISGHMRYRSTSTDGSTCLLQVDVREKFGDSRLNNGRIIRLFGWLDPVYQLLCSI